MNYITSLILHDINTSINRTVIKYNKINKNTKVEYKNRLQVKIIIQD